MKKFVCTVCGYVYEGEAAPAECPVCHAPASKFKEQSAERTWAAEHVVGVAQGVSEDTQRLVYTGRKLLMKKLSTLQNSLNYLVKLSQTAQRKILRCV